MTARRPREDTRRPRSRDGIHPERISSVRNVETPLGSGCAGRPDARKAEFSSGKRRPKKRRPAAERRRECITGWIGHLPRRKPADVGLVDYLTRAERAVKIGGTS